MGDFTIRLLVVPIDHKEARIWIGASPFTKAELNDNLKANANTHLTPHITLHGNKVRAQSIHAEFTRQESETNSFSMAVIP